MKRTLSFIIKAAISAGLVALVARNLDVAEIGTAIAQIPIGVIGVAFMAIFVQTFLVAMRWRIIMHAIGGELGYRSAVEAVLVGLFFNQGLPSSLGGDTVRVWQVHGAGTPLRIAVRSVVIDRLVGLLALAILAGAGLPLLATRVGSGPLWGLAALLAGGGILGVAFLTFAGKPLASLGPERLAGFVADLANDLRTVLGQPGLVGPVVGSALLAHCLTLVAVMLLAQSLGLTFGLADALALVPSVLIVSVLPISLAGWGVREGTMVAFFSAAGFIGPEPFAISILIGLLVLANGLIGGVVWMLDSAMRNEIQRQQA